MFCPARFLRVGPIRVVRYEIQINTQSYKIYPNQSTLSQITLCLRCQPHQMEAQILLLGREERRQEARQARIEHSTLQ